MLEEFRKAKQKEIARLRAQALPNPWPGERLSFAAALARGEGIAVIAEYKRASPSRGEIRKDLPVEEVARQYREGGASAISILTEEDYFQGDMAFLERAHGAARLPLLRKDFIFDPLQVIATAATPASALLLIARMLDAARLRSLREQAEVYGMEAVVEIFDQGDLQVAREAGARVIQVNARDLDTLQVSREACLRLMDAKPGELWICASGIEEPAHLAAAREGGFHGALVGTALMRAPRPGEALAQLLEGQCA